MAAFIAICGVPKGCGTMPSDMVTGMFTGMVIAGAGVALIGAGVSTGDGVVVVVVVGEGGVVGEGVATAHDGGSGSAALSSSGRSSAKMQPLPVWVPLWW